MSPEAPCKDIFRYALNHGLLTLDEVERWLLYRDNCNLTAHDYGFDLAEETLPIIPEFIMDVERLIQVIKESNATKR